MKISPSAAKRSIITVDKRLAIGTGESMSRRKDIERNNIRDEDAARIMQQMFGDSPSPVVQAALQARAEYIARGGKPLSRDEINEEVARRRGGSGNQDDD